MVQKETPVFFRHVKRKWLADQSSAGPSEKFRGREVDFFDSAYAVETDITDRRELEKIHIPLNSRFQCRLGMFENRSARGSLDRTISLTCSVSRKLPGHMRWLLCVFHVRTH